MGWFRLLDDDLQLVRLLPGLLRHSQEPRVGFDAEFTIE